MLYLDGISLSKIIPELENNILNKKIGKIFQNSSLSLSLNFGKKKLIFSCSPSFPICYITEKKEERVIEENSNFLMILRKYIVNSALKKIEQVGYDRIIKFTFSKLNALGEIEKNYLYFEIMGKHSNIILTDDKEEIIGLLKKFSIEENSLRFLFKGAKYVQPVILKKENPNFVSEENFNKYLNEQTLLKNIDGIGKKTTEILKSYEDLKKSLREPIKPVIYLKDNIPILATVLEIKPKDYDDIKEYETFNEMIVEYIDSKLLASSFVVLKNKLVSKVEKEIKKAKKIIKNIEKDIIIMSNYKEYKERGDIFASIMYSVKRGDKIVKTYDFYNNKDIEIEIDPLLSPQNNLNKIYKKYSKLKKGLKISNERILEFKNRKFYLESVLFFINSSEKINELKNLEIELIEEKIIKERVKTKKKKKAKDPSYGTFEIGDKVLYYGRNNKENDYLTFKFANKNDVWFHIKDIPGSHIIVRKEDFEESDDFIKKIGELAAYHSKASIGEKVVVDYTEKKNLNKPKGAPLGFVTYNIFKSIIIKKSI
ncbi:MAG: NFACT family protein [Fusobacterium sp. JB021]|nr:NFACT family protein [Fusobacterium sp. JB021]